MRRFIEQGKVGMPPFLRFACLILALIIASGTVSAQQLLGKTIVVHSKDEYAKIDTRATKAMLERLRTSDASVHEIAVVEAKSTPNAYAPPVLFEIAKDLYAKEQPEEATYWYMLARTRLVNDSDILLDETAKSGIAELVQLYREGFAAYAPTHINEVWVQLNRAIEWDRANPPAYDRRWLALHGMDAISSALANNEGDVRQRGEITIPRSQWSDRDEANRSDILAKLKAHLDREQPRTETDANQK